MIKSWAHCFSQPQRLTLCVHATVLSLFTHKHTFWTIVDILETQDSLSHSHDYQLWTSSHSSWAEAVLQIKSVWAAFMRPPYQRDKVLSPTSSLQCSLNLLAKQPIASGDNPPVQSLITWSDSQLFSSSSSRLWHHGTCFWMSETFIFSCLYMYSPAAWNNTGEIINSQYCNDM